MSGDIVWVNGPYQAGTYPDVNIFRNDLRNKLSEKELIVADSGYMDNKCVFNDGASEELLQNIRARQESVFKRIRQFHILSHRYRHGLDKLSNIFFAVAQLTQISIENGGKLFSINL